MVDLSSAYDVPERNLEGARSIGASSRAFAYYRQEGVPKVVCEEKHMGSRAVVVICRDEQVALKRFGIPLEEGDGFGVILHPHRAVAFLRTGSLRRKC